MGLKTRPQGTGVRVGGVLLVYSSTGGPCDVSSLGRGTPNPRRSSVPLATTDLPEASLPGVWGEVPGVGLTLDRVPGTVGERTPTPVVEGLCFGHGEGVVRLRTSDPTEGTLISFRCPRLRSSGPCGVSGEQNQGSDPTRDPHRRSSSHPVRRDVGCPGREARRFPGATGDSGRLVVRKRDRRGDGPRGVEGKTSIEGTVEFVAKEALRARRGVNKAAGDGGCRTSTSVLRCPGPPRAAAGAQTSVVLRLFVPRCTWRAGTDHVVSGGLSSSL